MPDDVNVVTEQKTTEVLDLNGKNMSSAASPLAGIFDKIESAKEEGRSAEDAIKDATPVVPEAKPVETKVEAKKPDEKEVVKSDLDSKLDEAQSKKDDSDEDPRSALKRSTEEKKREEKKVDVKKEEVKSEDAVADDELAVLPHDKPKTAKRIQALLNKVKEWETTATTTKKEAEERAAKLADLEKKLGEVSSRDPATDEKVKKQLDELAMFRRRYELDQDPEIKTRFDARVEATETAIVATLKKRGFGDPLLNLIKEEGGWRAFSDSSRVLSIPDGEGGTRQVTASELADLALKQLPLGERKEVEAAMMEQVQTKRDRERFFKEEQAKANDFFKKKDEDVRRQTAEQAKQFEEAKKTIETWQKTVEASDWLKDRELPANATLEAKAEVDEWNKQNKQLKSILAKNLSANKLDDLLPIIQESVLYYNERRAGAQLRRENERLKAELAAKEEAMTKFKTAGRSTQKSGSISIASTPQTAAEKRPRTLEESFAVLERGESLDE